MFLGDTNYSGFPSDDDSGCALDEYAWVPPGLTAEQVGKDDKHFLIAGFSLPFTKVLGSIYKNI